MGIRFGIEGQQNVPVLHAQLCGDFGNDHDERDVNLAEHIYNYGGNLQYRRVPFVIDPLLIGKLTIHSP